MDYRMSCNTPFISRQILFGNPERADPQISPDGKFLAYLGPDKNNVLQVWLRTFGGQDDTMITADKKRGIRAYFWTYNSEQLVYLQDTDGDENWHLYAVNIKSNIIRDLTPFQTIQVQVVACDPKFPYEMLVGMNLNDPRKHDVYRINLKSGEVELDTNNPGNVVSWTTDAEFQVRAATASGPDGGWDLMIRKETDQSWKTVRHWGPEDRGSAVSFSANGKTLYLLGSHGANTVRLIALNLLIGKEVIIAEDPQFDIDGIFIHPIERIVQAVSFYRDRLNWQILDESVATDFSTMFMAVPGNGMAGGSTPPCNGSPTGAMLCCKSISVALLDTANDSSTPANREWGGKMHEDLIDGVHWIVNEGAADAKRIAVMGVSYGGYATLAGLTFTPNVFAAGVDIVGPSNLLTLLKSIPPYWRPLKAMFSHRVGDPDTERDFLKSRSPLFFAEHIQAPLLIGQGANDPRVPQAESEQIVEAMRKAKKPVDYVLYTDEGHGFARPENNLHFFARAEEFLAKYLGGRCEPMEYIHGHSGVMKESAI
jgi:dipeptidyl aminopeptidase/acylaminoacyl peptidase